MVPNPEALKTELTLEPLSIEGETEIAVWPFHTTHSGLHTALFWVPVVTSRENFTVFGALDVLQMKEEDVFMFFAAGTQLGGTNLDFQMEQ